MAQIQVIQSEVENIDFQKNNGTTYTFSADYLKNKRKRMAIDNVYRQKDNTTNIGFILLKQGTIRNDLLIVDLDLDIGQAVFNTSFWIDYSDVARLGLVFYTNSNDQAEAANPFYWEQFLLRTGNESLYRYTSVQSLTDMYMKIVVDAMTPDSRSYVDYTLSNLTNGVVQLDIKYFNMNNDYSILKTRVDDLVTNVNTTPYISLGNSAVYIEGLGPTMPDDLNRRYSHYSRMDSDTYFELISDTVLDIADWNSNNTPRFADNNINEHNNGFFSTGITSFKPFKNSGALIFEKAGRYLIKTKWAVDGYPSLLGKNVIYGSTHIYLNNKDIGMNNTDAEEWIFPKQYATFSATKIIRANVDDVLRVAAFVWNDFQPQFPFFFNATKQLIEIHYLGI